MQGTNAAGIIFSKMCCQIATRSSVAPDNMRACSIGRISDFRFGLSKSVVVAQRSRRHDGQAGDTVWGAGVVSLGWTATPRYLRDRERDFFHQVHDR